ncbi:hypothetical protein BaRGS_00027683 [Batillaria attramentaria]|uniref:Uncharacterized protein n=1 Tax=Batillaria attramentaria TaxID=370345 RepID=A0ABD0K1U1_9CAEN
MCLVCIIHRAGKELLEVVTGGAQMTAWPLAHTVIPILLLCTKRVSSVSMIECALQDACKKRRFYHCDCVCITRDAIPDKRHCSHECETHDSTTAGDGVCEYARTVTWQGLNHIGRRLVIIEYWRPDLLQFWAHRHIKYIILAHNLLTFQENDKSTKKPTQKGTQEDIEEFVTMYHLQKLFHYQEGRAHPSFPAMQLSSPTQRATIKDPNKLKEALQRYSYNRDLRRRILP